MTTAGPTSRPTRPPRRTLVPALAVVIATLVAGALAPVAAAAPTASYGSAYVPSQWSNGVVTCAFNATTPGVSVSAAQSTDLSLWLGMATLHQVGLGGLLSISASLAGATWTPENASIPGTLALSYAASVPVRSSLGTVGNATVVTSFSLLTPTAAAGNLTDRVAVSLSISDWPWLALGDPLEVDIAVAAPLGAATHLAESPGPGASILGIDNATGQTAVFLTGDANATMVNGTSGLAETIAVVTSMVGLTPAAGTLAVSFGPAANDARSVNYTSEVFVVPVSGELPIVHVPIADLVAAAGTAIVVSLAIAGVTRRVRRSPSDLEYVNEPEEAT